MIAGTTAFGTLAGLAVQPAAAAVTTNTIAGATRYQTSAQVAEAKFPSGVTSGNVVLATGLNFPDALAGNYLAGQLGAPILLTTQTTSDSNYSTVTGALSALKAKNVYILGQTSAVGADVQADLTSKGYTVVRIGGATRYDTAQMADTQPGQTPGKGTSGNVTCIVATGQNFADALAAGPLAWNKKFPLVLTDGTQSTLGPQAQATISADGCKNFLIMGGSAAISSGISGQLAGLGTVDKQFAGADRYDTANQLATYEIANYAFSGSKLFVASGVNFPDALSAGPLAGDPGPIVPSNGSSVKGTKSDQTCINAGPNATVTGVGGTAANGSAVQDCAADASTGNAGGVALAASPASVPANGTSTSTITVTVTSNGTPVSGDTVNFTTNGSPAGACGTLSSLSGTTNSSGQVSSTYTASSVGGTCTITATESNNKGTGTTTVTQTTGNASTVLPQLTSATIVNEFSASTANGTTTFPGTEIQYVFASSVSNAALKNAGFVAYTANGQWRFIGSSGCVGGPGGPCAFHDPTNPNAVDVFFQNGPAPGPTPGPGPAPTCNNSVAGSCPGAAAAPDLTTGAGAGTLTLAAVADQGEAPAGAGPGPAPVGSPFPAGSGAAATLPPPSGPNLIGAVPIGTASSTSLSPGVTAAPNPESIGTPRVACTTACASGGPGFYPNSSAIDVTFDKGAFDTGPAGAAATNITTFSLVFTPGNTPVGAGTGPSGTGQAPAATQEETCVAPGQSNTSVGSSLTVPGYNTTPPATTITIVCPNPTSVAAGAAMPASAIARVVVQPDGVSTANPTTTACPAPPASGTTGASPANFCNPLEVSDTPNSSDGAPVLTNVTIQPNTPTGSSTAVWTFDQPLAAAPVAASTQVYTSSGATIPCTGAAGATSGPTVNPSNAAQYSCVFAGPTTLNSAVGGAEVATGATAFGTGKKNADTEIGASNPSTSGITPGTIAAPQLKSVHGTNVPNGFGGTTPGAVYTFSEPVAPNGGAAAPAYPFPLPANATSGLVMWDPDGTELFCTSATIGTGTASNTVTCSAFNAVPLTGPITAATASQITSATWGGAEWHTVQGNPVAGATDTDWNPEAGMALS